MTNPHWEKVDRGRYATEMHGHILQAIRTDEPYHPGQRPYLAIVDRIPLEPGAWSLSEAKTKAIQHVERQSTKSKAERVFKPKNGHAPAEDPLGPIFFEPEAQPVPEPEPVEPELEHALTDIVSHLGRPGQLAITGDLNDGDLLNTLNALRSALELLREHAVLECTVNLPPVMKL